MEESIDFFKYVMDEFQMKKKDIHSYSPLTLAYIGDGIYEIVIRSIIVGHGNEQVNKLHKKSSQLVKAQTQAEMIRQLMDGLTDEELQIYKRGRNAKSYTSAKNADIADYRTATGFEALMGYLYMEGQSDRMLALIKKGLQAVEQEER
jgi:ribonuclease-3 family protein